MKERIKQLRKSIGEKGITQQEFADVLGLKRNTIATYEIGKATPSDRVIADICNRYSVNEEWLRNGTGEMFKQPSDEIGYYVEDLLEYDGHGNPFYDMIIEMMKEYQALDEKSKTVIREYFKKVSDGIHKEKQED